MKLKKTTKILLTHSLLLTTLLISGCKMTNDELFDMGAKGFKAMATGDAEIIAITDEACADYDKKNSIAANNSLYGKRLANITKNLPQYANGQKLDFKVYQTKQVNAWAMANGCIRVYSGLMDLMTDDEVRGVLGHEIGHVDLGHTKKHQRLSILTSLGREALSKHKSNTLAQLNQSKLADLTESLINAQFSQKQESDSDDYAYNLLVNQKLNPAPLASGLRKLKSSSSLFSSHPGSEERAKNIEKKMAQSK